MSEVKWHTIYPCYINSEFTRDKGRRVSKAFTVNNPKAEEIITALTEAGYPAKFEQK
jgi:signal recognition particle subunit SEC65